MHCLSRYLFIWIRKPENPYPPLICFSVTYRVVQVSATADLRLNAELLQLLLLMMMIAHAVAAASSDLGR